MPTISICSDIHTAVDANANADHDADDVNSDHGDGNQEVERGARGAQDVGGGLLKR